MEELGVKMVHEGSVWLIEVLLSMALITASAGIVAQYCWRISCTQQEVACRLRMLTAIHNSIDSYMRTNNYASLRTERITPRIQSDIPEIAALGVDSFYRIEFKGGGTKGRSFFYAGILNREGGIA